MNRLDRIDQLRNAGIKASTILDEMTRWFSEDDIKKFYDDFVRGWDVTFGEEEEECPRCKDCGDDLCLACLIAANLDQ